MSKTDTLEQRLGRLREAEKRETAVLTATIKWAPAGEKAEAERRTRAAAERGVQAARDELSRALADVSRMDRGLGDELHRLAAQGKLSADAVADYPGPVKRVAAAVDALDHRRVELTKLSSSAVTESAALWGEVLRAFDTYRAAADSESAGRLGRMLGASAGLAALPSLPPNAGADDIAEAAKQRLRDLKA